MSYCKQEEVNNLFGDVSDDIPEGMFDVVINNSTAWIEANLKRNYVPIPTTNVDALRTAAIYYAASDILSSLYHGDDLQVQYDIWFQKAQRLLDKYIESYLNSEADESELVTHQMVKHSRAMTYNQKRGRVGVQRWVR